MARKEPGIQYYPIETNHIFNKKVRLLFNEFKADGYWVWQCIMNEAYRLRGYFFDTSDHDEVALFASDICKVDAKLVQEIIECCLKRKLFDESLYESYGVLTAPRLQENYIRATAERRKKGTGIEFFEELLLIDISPQLKNIAIIPGYKSNLPGNNSDFPGSIPGTNHQSKVKYSKVEYSKVKEDTNVSSPVEPKVSTSGEELELFDLKKAFKTLSKDKASLVDFIRKNRPAFIEPYVLLWNIWAVEYLDAKRKVDIVTAKRKTHFTARIKEKEFDFIRILSIASKSNMLIEKKWFTFDFCLNSQDNYTKIYEGKYDNPTNSFSDDKPNDATARLEELIAEGRKGKSSS